MAKKHIRHLIIITHDQLNLNISSLKVFEPSQDVLTLIECPKWFSNVAHHKRKLLFIMCSYRHFYQTLINKYKLATVEYLKHEDLISKSKMSFAEIIDDLILTKYNPERVCMTEPSEYHVMKDIENWYSQTHHDKKKFILKFLDDDRFFCSRNEFADWRHRHKLSPGSTIRMEAFYRDMRVKTGLLMKKSSEGSFIPLGGKWNFDKDNRKPLPHSKSKSLQIPPLPTYLLEQDDLEVLHTIESHFPNHYGTLEDLHLSLSQKGSARFEFGFTCAQAEQSFENFVANRLPLFGDYQDAMSTDNYFLYHGVISAYLNIGLLDPHQVCQRVADAHLTKGVKGGPLSLNCAEGFIRQILGWREYMRGIYWTEGPAKYANLNYLGASNHLPLFYWTQPQTKCVKGGKRQLRSGPSQNAAAYTKMNCVNQVLRQTYEKAYAHHIQRLMVTGNLALLMGILPTEICEWYLAVYIDAYDWVELPNTLGMSSYADGGLIASKPYVSSGNYINKMSDYCADCYYNVKLKFNNPPAHEDAECFKVKNASLNDAKSLTKKIKKVSTENSNEQNYPPKSQACPFNYLYWNFYMKHADKFASNPRIGGFTYKHIRVMKPEEQLAIQKQANIFIKTACGTSKSYTDW